MREIDHEIIEHNFRNPSGLIKNYLDLDSLLQKNGVILKIQQATHMINNSLVQRYLYMCV